MPLYKWFPTPYGPDRVHLDTYIPRQDDVDPKSVRGDRHERKKKPPIPDNP
jgi:hypothetical protein